MSTRGTQTAGFFLRTCSLWPSFLIFDQCIYAILVLILWLLSRNCIVNVSNKTNWIIGHCYPEFCWSHTWWFETKLILFINVINIHRKKSPNISKTEVFMGSHIHGNMWKYQGILKLPGKVMEINNISKKLINISSTRNCLLGVQSLYSMISLIQHSRTTGKVIWKSLVRRCGNPEKNK